jgi:glutamine amidotransferase
VLGICLGMQLLFDSSAEGETACLGILRGRAERFAMEDLPVPHMGWNQLEPQRPTPLLAGIEAGAYAYFVHSYAIPLLPETVAASTYGAPFTAIASARNFHGAQFHPERSSATGARLLANFLEMR